jgi:transcriptional regulator with XRE-family HTH domain
MSGTQPSPVGQRIRKYRGDRGLSLGELAEKARVSKSYLWSLENDPTASRPSGDTLYAIAEALGVTMSDLLGRKLLVDAPDKIPKSLKEFAAEARLPEADVRMLATIRFRGQQPQTKERWEYIYRAIRMSESIDSDNQPEPRKTRS